MAAVNYRDLLLVGTSPRSTPSLSQQALTAAAAAQTTATQALSDATTKAEEARVAAINAAATAADAKVAAAKVTSDAYADGKVTAEEQRAINDATAKANAAQAAAVAAAALDATAKANLAKAQAIQETRNNLSDLSWWARDAAIPWSLNGEYNRIIGIPADAAVPSPTGSASDLAWFCQEISDDGQSGGGWSNAPVTLDPTKMYRFTLPIYRFDGAGQSYFGVKENFVADLNTTTANSNPYFASVGLPAGKWFLFVGYLFPAGSIGNSHAGAGVYDMTNGELLTAGANFNQLAGVTQNYHRAYQYYATQNARQVFGRPSVVLVDGSEQSLNSILASGKAAAAQTTATDAASSASASADELVKITADTWLSKGEKPAHTAMWQDAHNKHNGIIAQAASYGVSTSAMASAKVVMDTYLAGLSPLWSDQTQDTPINSTTLWGNFTTYTNEVQVVLNAIAAAAKVLANTAQTTAVSAVGASFVASANMSAQGNIFTKTTANGWDAGFWSKDAFVGGAIVTFRPAQTDKYLAIGLNTDAPTDGNAVTSLDYAIQCSVGGVINFDEGASGGAQIGTYAIGDVLGVSYDGVNIRYLQNGVALRTVPVVITAPLFADSSFYSPNATVSNVQFSAMTSLNEPSITNSSIASGANLCFNSDFSAGLNGWQVWYNPNNDAIDYCNVSHTGLAAGGGTAYAINNGVGDGSTTLQIHQTNGITTGYFDLYSQVIAVERLKTYIVSAYMAGHRCSLYIFCQYLNAAGTIVGNSNVITTDAGYSGGNPLNSYDRTQSIFTVPADATNVTAVRVALRKGATTSGQSDSWAFIGRVMLEEVGATATKAGAWCASGAGANSQNTNIAIVNGAITGIGGGNNTQIDNSYSLSKSANSVLDGVVSVNVASNTAGFVAGTLTWDASGNRTGGYGVAMTSKGFVATDGVGNVTFSANASTGSAYFGGTLGAGIVNAQAIATDAVTANKIQAGAVTTSKLTIQPNSLVANSDFATGDFTNWRLYSGGAYQSIVFAGAGGSTAVNAPSKYVAKYTYSGTALSISSFAADRSYEQSGADRDGFAVVAGSVYTVSISASKSADYASSGFSVIAYFYRADGTYNTGSVWAITSMPLTTSWAKYSGTFTAPTGAVRCWLYVYSNAQTAGSVYFSNLTAIENLVGVTIGTNGIKVFNASNPTKVFFDANKDSPPWVIGTADTSGSGESLTSLVDPTNNTQAIKRVQGAGSVSASSDANSITITGLGSEIDSIAVGSDLSLSLSNADVGQMLLSVSAAGAYRLCGQLHLNLSIASTVTIAFGTPTSSVGAFTTSVSGTAGTADNRSTAIGSVATTVSLAAGINILRFDLPFIAVNSGAVQLKLGVASGTGLLKAGSAMQMYRTLRQTSASAPTTALTAAPWGVTAVDGFAGAAHISFNPDGTWTTSQSANGTFLTGLPMNAAGFEIQFVETGWSTSGTGSKSKTNGASAYIALSATRTFSVSVTTPIGTITTAQATITVNIRPVGGSPVTLTGLTIYAEYDKT